MPPRCSNHTASVGAWHDAAAPGTTVLVHLSAASVGPAHTSVLPPRHRGAADHQVGRQTETRVDSLLTVAECFTTFFFLSFFFFFFFGGVGGG